MSYRDSTDQSREVRAGRRPSSEQRLFTPAFCILLAAQVGFGYAFSSFFLLPKYLATELGASSATIGWLTCATSVLTAALMLYTGSLVDRFGRRAFVVYGALTMSVACASFAFVSEMGPLVYLLRAVQAIAFTMVFVGGAAATVDLAPPARLAEALGYFGLTGLAMNAISPAIVETLAAGPGWQAAFLAAAAGALVCSAAATQIPETRAPASDDVEPVPMSKLVMSRDQVRTGVVMACAGAGFATMFVFHQLYALELGIREVRVFFVAYSVAAIFMRTGFSRVGDRFGRQRTAVAALVLYCLSILGMAELESLGLALLGGAFGAAHGVFYPTYSALAVELVPENARARVVALLQAWFNLGIAGSTAAFGWLAGLYGFPLIFAISASLLAFAIVLACTAPTARGRAALRPRLTTRVAAGSPAQTMPPALPRLRIRAPTRTLARLRTWGSPGR